MISSCVKIGAYLLVKMFVLRFLLPGKHSLSFTIVHVTEVRLLLNDKITSTFKYSKTAFKQLFTSAFLLLLL